MWKLEIKDRNYNNLDFIFEDLTEAGSFAATAINKSKKELSITLKLVEKDGEEDEG